MSNLSCFLAGNVEKRETKKVVISDRFKEKGKPIEWEIRSISADEDESIRKICTKRVPVTGKKNQYTNDFDGNAYLAKLAAKSIVFPNLNDAELQNSYGAMSAEQLIKVMLYKDEFDRLSEILVEESQNEEITEMVDEAKN